MDDSKSLFLNWTYFYQEKSMDELTRLSVLLNMEVEDMRLKAEQEIILRDQQIYQLKQLLAAAIKERYEAQESCQKLLIEKLLLQQELLKYHNSTQQNSAISSIEDVRGIDSSNNNGLTSSDCDESIVSSPLPQDQLPIVLNKPLPEKGKLLEAVMKAGPLLQTLLLAGPLPQWRHPPPSLDTYQIPPPPLAITSPLVQMKRGLPDGSDCN